MIPGRIRLVYDLFVQTLSNSVDLAHIKNVDSNVENPISLCIIVSTAGVVHIYLGHPVVAPH